MELNCCWSLRCKDYATAPEELLPEGHVAKNYGTEITFKSSVRITEPKNDQGHFCDEIFTLRRPKSIVQK